MKVLWLNLSEALRAAKSAYQFIWQLVNLNSIKIRKDSCFMLLPKSITPIVNSGIIVLTPPSIFLLGNREIQESHSSV